ncbi:hypothetical protein pb186bvf_019670 [Paramecium bursaria]
MQQTGGMQMQEKIEVNSEQSVNKLQANQVVISQKDVDYIMKEFSVDKFTSLRILKLNQGDLKAAIRNLVC